jgi:hypothetical protein
MLVAGIGELPQPRHDLVLVGEQIVEHRRAVSRDRRRTSGHRQRKPGLRARDVVGPVASLGHPINRVGRLVRGAHDPIAQQQVPEAKRLE